MEGFIVHKIPNWSEKTLFMAQGRACAPNEVQVTEHSFLGELIL